MANTAQPGSKNTEHTEQELIEIEAAILKRIEAGEIFEDMDDLSPKFRAILKMTADLAAVSEVSVLTWAYTAYRTAHVTKHTLSLIHISEPTRPY